MIERLKEILDFYSLTASNFADKIDVPRSSISHLLSGRNKPSLDFIMKVEQAFDEVELDWLVYGKGDFPKNLESNSKHQHQESLFGNQSIIEDEKEAPSLTPQNEPDVTEVLHRQMSASGKKLIKVILLYDDGSFNEYKN